MILCVLKIGNDFWILLWILLLHTPPMNDTQAASMAAQSEKEWQKTSCKFDPLCSIWHLLCPLARERQAYPQEPYFTTCDTAYFI